MMMEERGGMRGRATSHFSTEKVKKWNSFKKMFTKKLF